MYRSSSKLSKLSLSLMVKRSLYNSYICEWSTPFITTNEVEEWINEKKEKLTFVRPPIHRHSVTPNLNIKKRLIISRHVKVSILPVELYNETIHGRIRKRTKKINS